MGSQKTEKQRAITANINHHKSVNVTKNSKQMIPKKKTRLNLPGHKPVNKSIPAVITVDSSVTSSKKKAQENISETGVSPF